jgi:hypothetical protein
VCQCQCRRTVTLALWRCLVGWPMALAVRRRDHRAFKSRLVPPRGTGVGTVPVPRRTNRGRGRGRGRGRRDGDGNLKVPGCPRPGLDATLESRSEAGHRDSDGDTSPDP